MDTHILYTSRDITVSALTAGSIHVNVSIYADPADIDKWRAIVESDLAITAQAKPKHDTISVDHLADFTGETVAEHI
ncbi:hypothetical protein ACC713_36635, partial [Rhizobium johnstonii]